jgi:hypothetical protein
MHVLYAMRYSLVFLLLVVIACSAEQAQTVPPVQEEQTGPTETRQLVARAKAIAFSDAERVWTGFSKIPFSIVLVQGDTETLFCHPNPVEGFVALGFDQVIGCEAFERERKFPPGILASFPAFDEVSSIIVGTPAAAGRSESEWVLTLLHERFHQVQDAAPDIYKKIDGLDLKGDFENAMWMLEYPFPYEQEQTVAAFQNMKQALVFALARRGTDSFSNAFQAYWLAREQFRHTVSAKDWRYFEFQLWKEGIARWTEYGIATLDQAYFGKTGDREEELSKIITSLNLDERHRQVVYWIGAGEGLLLEAAYPDWQQDYWQHPLSLRDCFLNSQIDLRQQTSAFP